MKKLLKLFGYFNKSLDDFGQCQVCGGIGKFKVLVTTEVSGTIQTEELIETCWRCGGDGTMDQLDFDPRSAVAQKSLSVLDEIKHDFPELLTHSNKEEVKEQIYNIAKNYANSPTELMSIVESVVTDLSFSINQAPADFEVLVEQLVEHFEEIHSMSSDFNRKYGEQWSTILYSAVANLSVNAANTQYSPDIEEAIAACGVEIADAAIMKQSSGWIETYKSSYANIKEILPDFYWVENSSTFIRIADEVLIPSKPKGVMPSNIAMDLIEQIQQMPMVLSTKTVVNMPTVLHLRANLKDFDGVVNIVVLAEDDSLE